MAKQSKVPSARRLRDEEALLVRSAESLGRIIGSLQRQLEDLGMRMPGQDGRAAVGWRTDGNGNGPARHTGRVATRKPARTDAAGTAGRRQDGAAKVRSTIDRTSKRAAKSAGGRKRAGTGSGARNAAGRSRGR